MNFVNPAYALAAGLLAAAPLSALHAQTATVVRGSLDLAIEPNGGPVNTSNYRVGAGTGLDFDGEFIGDFRPTDFVKLRDLYAFFDPGPGCTLDGGSVRVVLETQAKEPDGTAVVTNSSQFNLTRQGDCGDPDFRPAGVTCTGDLAEYGAPGGNVNIFLGAYANEGLVDLRITWTPSAGSCAAQPLTGTATLTVGSFAPVPAELVRFDVAAAPRGLDEVTWSTASEIDVERFVVERAAGGGQDFEAVAEAPARGGASTATEYDVEVAAVPGVRYYRLVTVDEDGTRATSEVAVVGGEAPAAAIAVYPNPVSGVFRVSHEAMPAGEAEVIVYDALGRVVLERSTTLSAAGVLELDASGLAAGTYRVSLRSGARVATRAFRVSE